VQVAGVPNRTEPDRGEIDVAHGWRRLIVVGYDGWSCGE
jgi:hydroxypyruvate isomerase